jgi:hypothetical protein
VTAYVWPSRAEWQARAEYSVRTFCTPSERLEQALPGADWSTLAQDVEMEELATTAAKAVRPLLTAEIARLRTLLPDRPPKSRARAAWFVDLDDARYETATNLSALESMRTSIARAVRAEHWHTVAWELGRLYDHYPAIVLPGAVAAAVVRMRAIGDEISARWAREADRLVEEAVAAEVALRATDAGWEKELRRRARIDGARNGLTVHRIGAVS